KEVRAGIVDLLKSGTLRCVVATRSLALGIDRGAVDRLVLGAAPLSVSSLRQRVGRAGHDVGAVSEGSHCTRCMRWTCCAPRSRCRRRSPGESSR
ncbi:helicase-related protein, partial [Xanthomonas citri pv. citri]